MTYDVITIGSALLDVFVKSDKFLTLPASEYPDGLALGIERGGKTEVREVEVCSGGAGSNNAVSFARKGLKTAIISEMGTDLTAATIKEELKREQVDLGMLVEEQNETTGISTILVASDGSRAIAVFRGASGMLTETDINWNRLSADWLMISSLGGEMNVLSMLINFGRANGSHIAINPGKKELELADKWGGVSLFNQTDVLILNREEAGLLTHLPFQDNDFWGSKKAIIPGPNIVLITDGKQGGKVTCNNHVTNFTAAKVNTIEETGAGDGFGSGFVAALVKGKSIDIAIDWGKHQAASVVSYMGAKRGLLTLKEIEKSQ
jgi:ribokinase